MCDLGKCLTFKRKVKTPLPFVKFLSLVESLQDIPTRLLDDVLLLKERSTWYDCDDYIEQIKETANVASKFMDQLSISKTPDEVWLLQHINIGNKLRLLSDFRLLNQNGQDVILIITF